MSGEDYVPSPAPQQYDPEYLERELREIARLHATRLDLDASPQVERPRDGMQRYFDAAVFDPGAGTGMYVYTGGLWVKMS